MSEQEFLLRAAMYEADLYQQLEERGCVLQGVFGDAESPSFTYTIGLHRVPHPEFIVIGIPLETAAAYVVHLVDSVLKKGERFTPGVLPGFWEAKNDDIADGYLLEVTDSSERLTMANRIAGTPDPVPALQLIYPDPHGRFPWKEGYDIDPRIQPIMGLPPQ